MRVLFYQQYELINKLSTSYDNILLPSIVATFISFEILVMINCKDILMSFSITNNEFIYKPSRYYDDDKDIVNCIYLRNIIFLNNS